MKRALILTVFLAVGCGPASGSDETTDDVAEGLAIPTQGIYDSCAPRDPACLENVAHLGQAGFKVVVNYGALNGTPDEVYNYASVANQNGLRVAWPLNVWTSPYGGGGDPNGVWWDLKAHNPTFCPECTSNKDFVFKAAKLLRSHPGTWGWYIGDEVGPGGIEPTRKLATWLESWAPKKPRLFVARPNKKKLKPFIEAADFAGVDDYPIHDGASCVADPPVGPTAKWTGDMVRAAGRKPVMVLQSFSWSIDLPQQCGDRWPTSAELRTMRNAAVKKGHPALILWFCYHCIYDYAQSPEQRWSELKAAAF